MLRQKIALEDRIQRIEAAIAGAEGAEKVRQALIRRAKARIRAKAKPGKRRLRRTREKSWKLASEAARKRVSKLANTRIPKEPRANTTDPESRRLAILAVKQVMGVVQLARVLADQGYSGEPNLKQIGPKDVHELLIPQPKRATKSLLIREQKRLNQRRSYWLKRRGRIEATNGNTKEARGLRQFRIRGRLGAAIELALDAAAHNFKKLFAVATNRTDKKINLALAHAALAGA